MPVLSCRPSLAQAAWLFEQQFWPQLETFLYSFIAGEGISNAVWNIVFLREAAFLATPNVLMEPTIHFIASGAWSGHDRLDAMEKARRLFASLEHTTPRRHIHRPWIDPKEHDRRVTELINYASEQVNRRCNLANAIRRAIEARALPNDLAADLETVLQANGPI